MTIWVDIKECPFCGSDHSIDSGLGNSPIIANEHILGGVRLAIITKYRQCLNCGLIRQTPRLNADSIDGFYTSGAYRQFLNDTPEQQDRFERNRYENVLKKINTLEGRTLLDVGCSHGYLLDWAEAYTIRMGVEPNTQYVQTSRPVFPKIEHVPLKQWDVITCLHVLEHLADPFTLARQMKEICAPGGTILIETPGDQGQKPRRLAHLYHFPPWIIRKMFEPFIMTYFEINPHYMHMFRKAAL